MASWLKAAENLLEAVDRTVQNATGISEDSGYRAANDVLDTAASRSSDPGELADRGPSSGFGLKLGAIPFSQSGHTGSTTATAAAKQLPISFLRTTPSSSATSSPATRFPSSTTAAAVPLPVPHTSAPASTGSAATAALTAAAPAPTTASAPDVTTAAAASGVPIPFSAQTPAGAPAAAADDASAVRPLQLPNGNTVAPPTSQPTAPSAPVPSQDLVPPPQLQTEAVGARSSVPPTTPSAAPPAAASTSGGGASGGPAPAIEATTTPARISSSGSITAVGGTPMQQPPPQPPPPAAAAGTATPAAAPPPPAASEAPAATSSSAAGSSGKDAQLARVVDALRKRLDVYKAENQQLEDMLAAAEQRAADHLRKADLLEQELAAARVDQEALVNASAATATAQDVQITRLRQELESVSKQLGGAQAALEALQQQHQEMKDTKDNIEGGALEALRHQLREVETRLDAERRAHQAAKAAAAAREGDLEAQLQEGSGALAGMQRALEEAVARVRDMEQQAAMLGAENMQLQQKVAAAQSQAASQLSPEQQLQQQAEQEALQQALATARQEAAAALSARQAEVISLQQQVQQLQAAQAEAAAGHAGGLAEQQAAQQLQELRELLYQKQSQLERLAADKGAQQLLLERQVASLRDELAKANAVVAAERMQSQASSSRMAHDIIPMDALGEPYQRLARHKKLGGVVQASANFLDGIVATATHLLRQHPIARLAVFGYVVLIHMYVYFLLARMQRQALLLSAKEHAGALPGVAMPH